MISYYFQLGQLLVALLFPKVLLLFVRSLIIP